MNKRKLLTALLSFSPFLMMAQENAKGIINSFLQDWLLPTFLLFVVGGIVHGVISNQRNVTEQEEEKNNFKSFKNIGIMVAYYALAFAVVVAILAGGNELVSRLRVE